MDSSPASTQRCLQIKSPRSQIKVGGGGMDEASWMRGVRTVFRSTENGSESQTRHDWQRRLGITSAKTDLEIVDLLELHQTPSAHWTSARASRPSKLKLGLRHSATGRPSLCPTCLRTCLGKRGKRTPLAVFCSSPTPKSEEDDVDEAIAGRLIWFFALAAELKSADERRRDLQTNWARRNCGPTRSASPGETS
ncbi:uncharacterized protein Triagg1_5816 [Trichoderma aggressivum f. europaeum]|uniref:Uncharacterized protein n=1 Tax=Trichoderma aggressivum f. europaeum TaxID=173218 RepID=A0AAE1M2E5_9HYPO|nr:hypothetical protein Triagg1_5816 [Trichoderma aggressivum f. europaeum]